MECCDTCIHFNERGEYGRVCDLDWGHFYPWRWCLEYKPRKQFKKKKKQEDNYDFFSC